MFRGCYEHALDAKGRVSIPAHFRELLGTLGSDRLIVTSGISETPVLDAYPLETWQKFEEKIQNLPKFDPDIEAFRQLYIAGAMECPLDRQGRILLPNLLREEARIERDVVLTGDVEKIKIWSRVAWGEARDRAQANLQSIRETMTSLGI